MEFQVSRSRFISKTLLLMAMGLLVTFGTGYMITNYVYYLSNGVMLAAMAAELGIVFYLRARVAKMNPSTAVMWFLIYSAVSGITFGTVFIAYDLSTLLIAFITAAVMFFSSGMIGMTTKKDLSTLSRFLMMALIGLLAVSLIQIFVPLSGMNKGISIIGMLVFAGFTAYDMQMIKNVHENAYNMDPNDVSRFVTVAALALYLDFINIFLYLLRFASNGDD